MLLQQMLHCFAAGIGEVQIKFPTQKDVPNNSLFQDQVCGTTVRPGQSACTQLDAAKITHHGNDHICQPTAPDSHQDWFTGGARRFAVVITVFKAVGAQTQMPAVADVAGIMKSFSHFRDEQPGPRFVRGWTGQSDES